MTGDFTPRPVPGLPRVGRHALMIMNLFHLKNHNRSRSGEPVSESDATLHRDHVRESELKLPKLASLVIMITASTLLQISFFIIVSSSNAYALHLGGTSTFSGIVIGIPTLFSGLALVPLSKYDGGGYKLPLHLSCCSSILGHVLYALAYRANYLYLILIGRIVSGLSFTLWMYAKRYCSDPRIVGIRRRTMLAGWLVLGQALGTSLGPFAGGVFFKIGFRSAVFNGYTSPAWVMAAVWCVFWVCTAVWYEDIPLDQRSYDPPSLPSLNQSEIYTPTESSSTALTELRMNHRPPQPIPPIRFRMTYRQGGLIVCMCWFAMTCFFILGAWESNLPVYGASAPQFRWTPFAAGNFIALGAVAAFPFLIANVLFARRIEDRLILAVGTTLGLAALVVFLALLKARLVSYGSALVCWWAVALGFNMASTVTISTLSKVLPPSWNGKTSLAIQYSNYSGRVAGAIWGGSGVKVGMVNYVGLEIALVGIGGVLFISLIRDLKTKKG